MIESMVVPVIAMLILLYVLEHLIHAITITIDFIWDAIYG